MPEVVMRPHGKAQRIEPLRHVRVTPGVLGPKSNAHGPNEFLHVPYAKKLTAAVAEVIAALPVERAAQQHEPVSA